jgi:2-polyprenyl-3-methyl-5-hydroxy-6-metoxy-1,4-benzoquinol methylase
MSNDLTEEVFCLNFELTALAELMLKNDAERWIPGFIHATTDYDHIARYKLACEFVNEKNVLDIACGVGRGTRMMADDGKAAFVTGCDISENTVRYAKHRNKHDLVKFDVKNAEMFSMVNTFDVAISFETIEHLKDYKKFVDNIARSLKANGLFIVSTPISAKSFDAKPSNPYHVQEWGFNEFQNMISEFFEIKKVYVQLYAEKVPPPPLPSYFKRLVNFIVRKLKAPTVVTEVPFNHYSTLEEFTGQYPISDIGSKREGFQIVVAEKRQ